MNNPHGNLLVDRYFKEDKHKFDGIDLEIVVDEIKLQELKNIADGVYSPLEGFMTEDDYNSVLDNSSLANKLGWTIPIVLSVAKEDYDKANLGSEIAISSGKGSPEAVLVLESKYKLDKEKYCKQVYGTTDSEHPGVKMVESWDDYAFGGKIWYLGENSQINEFDLAPKATRKLFEEKGWQTIVGFQTRNPAHKAHEYIQRICLEFVDGLFINPIMGPKKPGDFKDEVILEVYKMLISQFYPKDTAALGIYQARMNYAGPREAVMHAIVRKNYGCTHFIVGRDHAGVGDYYDKFAAHKIFAEIENLEIEVMKVSGAFYDRRLAMFSTEKTSPFNEIYRVSPSGTQVREFVKERNYEALRQVMRDEVLDIIFSYEQPFVQ